MQLCSFAVLQFCSFTEENYELCELRVEIE